jgi:TonB family protein
MRSAVDLPSARSDVRVCRCSFVAVLTLRVISAPVLALTGLALARGSPASDVWDNRQPRILQTSPTNFPAGLAAEGVSRGEVRAVLHVDAEGKLVDCLVTAYTRRELAEELVAHLRDWNYEPARQRGEPVGSRFEVAFAFEARGMVVSLTAHDSIAASTNRFVRPALTTLVCRRLDLDEPIRAIHVVGPQHPGSRVALRSGQSTVLLDFYIDAEGRTRMPVVLRATHELYAAAAVEALMQWRFSPPLREGRPVLVRATQVFSFTDQSPELRETIREPAVRN